jgi:hypothetical protein
MTGLLLRGKIVINGPFRLAPFFGKEEGLITLYFYSGNRTPKLNFSFAAATHLPVAAAKTVGNMDLLTDFQPVFPEDYYFVLCHRLTP